MDVGYHGWHADYTDVGWVSMDVVPALSYMVLLSLFLCLRLRLWLRTFHLPNGKKRFMNAFADRV